MSPEPEKPRCSVCRALIRSKERKHEIWFVRDQRRTVGFHVCTNCFNNYWMKIKADVMPDNHTPEIEQKFHPNAIMAHIAKKQKELRKT